MEQRRETSLVEEGLREGPVLEGLEDLGGDASAEVDAAHCEDLEGDVAGFGSVGGGEDFEGFEADGAGAILGALADDGVGIFGGEAVFEPLRFVEFFDVAEVGVDILDADSGDDALEADAAVDTLPQLLKEGDLAIGSRGEVAVSAFGGDGAVDLAIPDEEGFAEAGAGGDQASMAFGVWIAGVEGEDLVGGEFGDAVAVGFEVVDEKDVPDCKKLLQFAGIEGPREIGELEAAFADGAGTAEAGGDDVLALDFSHGDELPDDFVEGGELVGWKFVVAHFVKAALGEVVKSEMDLGTAYVTSENHLFQLQSAGAGCKGPGPAHGEELRRNAPISTG